MPGAQQHRWTALIVEDDPAQRELSAMMLQELDLDVDQAGSAEEAIDRLRDRSGHVGLVISDIRLPGVLDGIGLVQRVAVLWPSVSLILTSGDTDLDPASIPDGATFVPKPWRALDIVAVTQRAAREDHSVHAVQL